MNEEQSVIVGEVEAGRAAKVRREVNKLIKATNASTFDLAELLLEMKENQYYSPEFESFSKYAKSLDLRYTKSYYLVAIATLMRGADIPRSIYEPIGLGKLRVISKLKLEGEFRGVPMPLVIRELTDKATHMSLEEVQLEVDTILGLVADESLVWLNIHLKKLARDNAVKPALALAKKHMPESQKKDDDGNFVDPGDGAALEMICANFLADPNYNPTEEQSAAESAVAEEEQNDNNIEAEIAALEQKLQDQ